MEAAPGSKAARGILVATRAMPYSPYGANLGDLFFPRGFHGHSILHMGREVVVAWGVKNEALALGAHSRLITGTSERGL
jgi:hypothetical protein